MFCVLDAIMQLHWTRYQVHLYQETSEVTQNTASNQREQIGTMGAWDDETGLNWYLNNIVSVYRIILSSGLSMSDKRERERKKERIQATIFYNIYIKAFGVTQKGTVRFCLVFVSLTSYHFLIRIQQIFDWRSLVSRVNHWHCANQNTEKYWRFLQNVVIIFKSFEIAI